MSSVFLYTNDHKYTFIRTNGSVKNVTSCFAIVCNIKQKVYINGSGRTHVCIFSQLKSNNSGVTGSIPTKMAHAPRHYGEIKFHKIPSIAN